MLYNSILRIDDLRSEVVEILLGPLTNPDMSCDSVGLSLHKA